MKNFILILTVFSAGYLFNDLTNLNLLQSAQAEIAGMDRSDLRSDSDFKKAVRDIIEDCEVEDDEIDC